MFQLPKEEADWAFNAYQSVRDRLPKPDFPDTSETVGTLFELADRIDTFLLDGFGVLNIGETAIPNAIERVEQLRAMGKRVLVVTNAAGYSRRRQLLRYAKLGFDLAHDDIVSSRETVLAAIGLGPQYRWGVMANPAFGTEELEQLDAAFLEDDSSPYASAEAFLMLGSAVWTEKRQQMLVRSLHERPRPVFVGNPDIVAPRESDLSREPGHFAHRIQDETSVAPRFFGKPFADIYDIAFQRLGGDFDPERTLMVGDTLHTDILGGRTAGIKTALISDYGSLASTDVYAAIKSSGICPDFVVRKP